MISFLSRIRLLVFISWVTGGACKHQTSTVSSHVQVMCFVFVGGPFFVKRKTWKKRERTKDEEKEGCTKLAKKQQPS